jgi:hypothetical protein
MLSRQQKRQLERQVEKARNRTYTYEECKQYVNMAMKDAQRKYDLQYSMCLATALSAPPLNFGKKRVCRTLKLFFDQIEGLHIGTITEDQIRTEIEKLGVIIRNDSEKLEIYLDPKKERIRYGR